MIKALTTTFTMNNSSSANSTVAYNSSIYFLEPHSDPSLIPCTGISLRSELMVLLSWKFWMTGIVSSVIIVLGCIGNGMAIYLLRRPKMTSAFNQLLIALCIFDTAFLLSNIPVTEVALGSRVLAGIAQHVDVVGQVSVCASVFMVVALSFERHFAICSPHAYRIHLRTTERWKHLIMYIIPVLVLACFFNIPLFVNLQGEIMKNATYVKINLHLRALHPLATTGLLPLLLLVVLNIRICKGIRVLRRPQPRRPQSSCSTTFGGQSEDGRNKRHSKEIRASYLAIVIVVSFAVLNMPRIIASSMEVFHTNLIIHCVENNVRYVPSMSFYKLDFVARLLMVINSAINFLVYCAVSTPFQESFVEAICPCIKGLKPLISSIFCQNGPRPAAENMNDLQLDNEVEDDDDDLIANEVELTENRISPAAAAATAVPCCANEPAHFSHATLVISKSTESNDTYKVVCVQNGSASMV